MKIDSNLAPSPFVHAAVYNTELSSATAVVVTRSRAMWFSHVTTTTTNTTTTTIQRHKQPIQLSAFPLTKLLFVVDVALLLFTINIIIIMPFKR